MYVKNPVIKLKTDVLSQKMDISSQKTANFMYESMNAKNGRF